MKLTSKVSIGLLFVLLGCADQADFKGSQPKAVTAKAQNAEPVTDEGSNEPSIAPAEVANEESSLAPAPADEDPLPISLEVILPADEIKAGKQTLQAKAVLSRPSDSAVVWSVEGPVPGEEGSINSNGLYTSPASVSSEITVTITASLENDPSVRSSKQLKIVPVNALFVGCKKGSTVFPITADVYSLPENTAKLPNYDAIASSKKTTVCMDKYDVPTRDFTAGFPDLPDLFEWFSLHTRTKLVIPVSGNYKFRLLSDDGANLYIDGRKVVDNDGTHSPRSVDGSVNLTAGEHELVLDYYQGPRTQIALQLFWATPGTSAFVIVPTQAFKP